MVLELLWAMVADSDPDGPELYITSDMKVLKPKNDIRMLHELDSRPAKVAPDMRYCFAQIIEKYQNQFGKRNLRARLRHPKTTLAKGPRKLSLYVLTDGVWQTRTDLRQVIQTLVEQLQHHKLTNKQIGIQFIRFGDDERGKKRLERLDSGLNLDLYVLTTTSSVLCLLPNPYFTRKHSEMMLTSKTFTDIIYRDVIDTTPANGSVWKMLLGPVNDTFDDDPTDEDDEYEIEFKRKTEEPPGHRNNKSMLIGRGKAKDRWG